MTSPAPEDNQLAQMREICHRILHCTPGDWQEAGIILDQAMELAEEFEDLDCRMKRGGKLPAEWRKQPAPPPTGKDLSALRKSKLKPRDNL